MTVKRVLSVVAAAAAIPMAAAPAAPAAPPIKGATYEHESSSLTRSTDVRFQVSSRGRTVKDVFIFIQVRCTNGRTDTGLLLDIDRPWRLAIARDGSFSGTFAAVNDELLDPFVASEQYWLAGRFARRGKTARLVVRMRRVGEGGTGCDTGDRRVTARRSRRR